MSNRKRGLSGDQSENGDSMDVDDDMLNASEPFVPLQDDVIKACIKLQPVPEATKGPPLLSSHERVELETVLCFAVDEEDWRDDWSGNVAYMDKMIANPSAAATSQKRALQQTILQWARKIPTLSKHVYNLLRYVYHMKSTPDPARLILAAADSLNLESIEACMRRVIYDPHVLRADGWTTKRAEAPKGATGGAYLIGAKIRWQDSDAVVIAYIHDADIGDLWKGFWIEEEHCFDLEAEEVVRAKRKWERRNGVDITKRKSSRYSGNADFSVRGVENGIVLAASFARGARQGVYWPARVMHASELNTTVAPSKRALAKQKINVVFLAPYWTSDEFHVVTQAAAATSSGYDVPLFHIENIEACADMVKEYTHGRNNGGLDIEELTMSFRFTGLPKSYFDRFLDSHRLATAFLEYAKHHIDSDKLLVNSASAGLFETHIMSVRAPLFPSVALQLPYDFILEGLRNRRSETTFPPSEEPAIQLHDIIDAMRSPHSLGQVSLPLQTQSEAVNSVSNGVHKSSVKVQDDLNNSESDASILSGLTALNGQLQRNSAFGDALMRLVMDIDTLKSESLSSSGAKREFVNRWTALKTAGRHSLVAESNNGGSTANVDWSKALERVYLRLLTKLSSGDGGNGSSVVLSDYRCNGHRTSDGCFERAVRLPAALKGARLAGAGIEANVALHTEVHARYVDMAERLILPMVHTRKYLDRMKSRCALAKSEDESLVLTDDSKGNGGEDTRGCKGTWAAAVAAVAVALTAVDKVLDGECVNAFCATRPPGHHAGRSLHSMKAVSNGFCVLNSVAAAALYAVTPSATGGRGLHRVCVIDFDVHHGNGTQDILCSTYDPRFLYVSLHAGGSHVNGVLMEDDPKHELHDLGGDSQSGIFPGRCGDSSPHRGVLNIPLGPKVASHDVGAALTSKVAPAVKEFVPDLIILSAGFDAHKADPMGLGALSAVDFGNITELACQLAFRSCGGRVVSVLEGGYGVPCCRPQTELSKEQTRPQPSKLVDLGDDLPSDMDDQVPLALQRRLEKCHAEGFVECVHEHVKALVRCNAHTD